MPGAASRPPQGHPVGSPRDDADSAAGCERRAGGNHRGRPFMDRVDDLGVVDPTQVGRGDPEVCMPELALYDKQRDPLTGHLDGVSVPELMLVPTSAQTPLCRPLGYAD